MKLRFLILVFFGVICICLIAFSWRRLIAPGKDEHIQQQRSPAYPGYNVDLQAAIKFVQANIILPSSQALTLANPKRSSFSQYGQDIIMNKNFFKNKTNGVYFEAGAWDGETLSNTLMFEKEFNWTGVLVEARQEQFNQMKSKNRKACLFHGCIDNVTKPELRYLHSAGTLSDVSSNKTAIEIICVPIAGILAALNITHIDYMVIDTEGTEPAIMDSIDYNKVKIDYVQIECNSCNAIFAVDKKNNVIFSPNMNKNENGIPISERQRELKDIMAKHGFKELLYIPPIDIIYH